MPIVIQALLFPFAFLYIAFGVIAVYGVICYAITRRPPCRRAEGAVGLKTEGAAGHDAPFSHRVSAPTPRS